MKLVSKIRTQQSKRDFKSKLKYINTGIGTAELSSVQMQAELSQFGTYVNEMAILIKEMLNSTDQDEINKIHKRLRKKDKQNVYENSSISDYTIKMARSEITEDTSDKLQRYISISADLKRLSNICVNISFELKDKFKSKIWFTPDQRMKLNVMYDKVLDTLQQVSNDMQNGDFHNIDITKYEQAEDEIDRLRDHYREELGKMGTEFDFNMAGSLIYFRLFILMEKMGDKVQEIAEKMSLELD